MADARLENTVNIIVVLIFVIGALSFLHSFKADQYRFTCKVKSICAGYKAQRSNCATAGSYSTCMSIKMADDNLKI